jgi:hypothetical protein
MLASIQIRGGSRAYQEIINHRRLDRYRDISKKLAQAEGLTDMAAHDLAREGKAVVWIDGGLHASEIVNHQAVFELH